ncbi:c-type cytochrome [Shewanella nanhaiensis]|uniref:C-type cytochrome n=1 Tax=Shewanella nanhaiensis TaxID=2864872 RepID=A0ABS7E1Q2_9GAMM|nr:c-type cytochrome [Shewanella nanhaiensis]MBW8183585.1 c-type cytochrome [Shewanella nanhaiensis]
MTLVLKASLLTAGLLLSSSAIAATESPEIEFSKALAVTELKLDKALLAQKFDLTQGEMLANTRCIACHGSAMLGMMPTYPSLMGQKTAYLFKQLIDFKQGDRTDPIMQAQAGMLSQAEMKNVAYYYSQQAPLSLTK